MLIYGLSLVLRRSESGRVEPVTGLSQGHRAHVKVTQKPQIPILRARVDGLKGNFFSYGLRQGFPV